MRTITLTHARVGHDIDGGDHLITPGTYRATPGELSPTSAGAWVLCTLLETSNGYLLVYGPLTPMAVS